MPKMLKMSDTVRALCKGGFRGVRAAVIGDIMLDHYIYGDVNRISPEAPVPVLHVKEDRYILGGAGNVVMNLRGLGLPVEIFGRVGNDEAGAKVTALFRQSGAAVGGLWRSGETIIKTRLLGGKRQQMLRFDREEISSPSPAEIAAALESIDSQSLVILSDYGKGTLTDVFCAEVIKLCGAKNIPVFVDPKGANWERYRGAAMVTPNLRELGEVYGSKVDNDDASVAEAGRAVRAEYGLGLLLVTRSERGATLISEGSVHHERASAIDVYDVSGAGDTMLATVAAFIAARVGVNESIALGNAASQIVIGKVGTYPVSAAELVDCLGTRGREADPAAKVLTAGEAALKIAAWRENNEKVIFTNGCFDIFHAGHLDSLTRAKNLGARLVVGLNSDASVRRLKGSSRPVNGERARAGILEALSAVDCVVVFEEDTPERLLSLLRPDVIAKGGDYAPEDVAGGQYAGEVVILPILDGYSTTSILSKR